MVMVSKFSNFPDKLSENDELRKCELSGSDCNASHERNNIMILSLLDLASLQ